MSSLNRLRSSLGLGTKAKARMRSPLIREISKLQLPRLCSAFITLMIWSIFARSCVGSLKVFPDTDEAELGGLLQPVEVLLLLLLGFIPFCVVVEFTNWVFDFPVPDAPPDFPLLSSVLFCLTAIAFCNVCSLPLLVLTELRESDKNEFCDGVKDEYDVDVLKTFAVRRTQALVLRVGDDDLFRFRGLSLAVTLAASPAALDFLFRESCPMITYNQALSSPINKSLLKLPKNKKKSPFYKKEATKKLLYEKIKIPLRSFVMIRAGHSAERESTFVGSVSNWFPNSQIMISNWIIEWKCFA